MGMYLIFGLFISIILIISIPKLLERLDKIDKLERNIWQIQANSNKRCTNQYRQQSSGHSII